MSKATYEATTQQVESCARLGVSERSFVEMLTERREYMLNICSTIDGESQIYRAQGRAQELDRLIKLISDAPTILSRKA